MPRKYQTWTIIKPNPGEIWRDVPGFENDYEVSSYGVVRSKDRYVKNSLGRIRRLQQRYLRPNVTRCGYMKVTLSVNGKHTTINVHQLVANAFLHYNYTDENLEVNHKDGNKFNNKLSNLEVVTRSENKQHAIKNGLWNCIGEKSPKAKLTQEDANCIRCKFNRKVSSVAELSKKFNVSDSTIRRILKNKSFTDCSK